jgi:REP element-mobilizing transposase RayT
MPKSRKQQIALSETPYYHIVSRCVRHAFLCGITESYNFEHRRNWMVERLALLSQMFAIDVAAFAIMSNHYHLVLQVDTARAKSWTKQEVLDRWTMIFRLPVLLEREALGQSTGEAESQAVELIIEKYRSRLCDISWFMRCLNEYIARLANQEDECSGHFWVARFKCQALLGEQALLNAMAYVDLNPVRAKMSPTPETSDYTSIQNRVGKAVKGVFHGKLLPFSGDTLSHNNQIPIPYRFEDYLELLDWTGRQLKASKRGAIDAKAPPILDRLGMSAENWVNNCKYLERDFFNVIGSLTALKKFCQTLNLNCLHGTRACQRCFP